MTNEQRADLERVLDYLWHDEANDYEANPEAGHIFESIKRLREYLNQ